jgi:hypothetical protein
VEYVPASSRRWRREQVPVERARVGVYRRRTPPSPCAASTVERAVRPSGRKDGERHRLAQFLATARPRAPNPRSPRSSVEGHRLGLAHQIVPVTGAIRPVGPRSCTPYLLQDRVHDGRPHVPEGRADTDSVGVGLAEETRKAGREPSRVVAGIPPERDRRAPRRRPVTGTSRARPTPPGAPVGAASGTPAGGCASRDEGAPRQPLRASKVARVTQRSRSDACTGSPPTEDGIVLGADSALAWGRGRGRGGGGLRGEERQALPQPRGRDAPVGIGCARRAPGRLW